MQHRLRRHQGGDLDVIGIDAQAGGVLAERAALHDERDHVGRRGKLDAIVHRLQQEGLGGAAGGAGGADPVGIDAGQGGYEIERADAVPQLQAERAEAPDALFGLLAEFVRGLHRVVVAHLVEGEDHVALAREVDGAGRAPRRGWCAPGGHSSSGRAGKGPRESRRQGAGLSGRYRLPPR